MSVKLSGCAGLHGHELDSSGDIDLKPKGAVKRRNTRSHAKKTKKDKWRTPPDASLGPTLHALDAMIGGFSLAFPGPFLYATPPVNGSLASLESMLKPNQNPMSASCCGDR